MNVETKKNETDFIFLVHDSRNRVGSDEGRPQDRARLNDGRAVGLDLGKVFLELESAASG